MIKIKDIIPKCLVLGTTFDDFSIATQNIDNSIEDLCSYIINDTNNYYFLNLESIWSKIGFQWIIYNDYGHFTKSNIPFTIIPVIPDANRLKSFYRLFDGIEQDITFLDSGFELQDLYSLETKAIVNFKPKNIKYVFGKRVTLKVNNKLDNVVVAKYRNEDNYDKRPSSTGLGLIVDKDTIQYFPLNIEYDENNKDIIIPNNTKYFKYYLYLYIKDNLQNSIDISSLFKYNNRPYVTRLVININSFTQPIIIPVFGYNGPNTDSESELYYNIVSEDNSKNGVIFDFINFTKDNKGKGFSYSTSNINNIEYKNIENCADDYIDYLYDINLRDKDINFIIDKTVCSKCKYIFSGSSRLTISVNNMNNIFVNLDFSKCTDSSNTEIELTEYSSFTIGNNKFLFISNNPINGYFSNKNKINEMFACTNIDYALTINLLHFKTEDNIFYNYSGGYYYRQNALYLLNQQVYINTSVDNSYIYIDYDENYNNKPFIIIDNTNVKNISYKCSANILYKEKITSYNVNIPIVDIIDKDIESIKQLSINISSILYNIFNNFVNNNITINQDVYICNSQNTTINKINQTENSKFIIYNTGIIINKNDLFDASYVNKILNAFIFDDNDKNKNKTIYIYTDYYKLITEEQKTTFIEHNYDIVEQI